ncbi:MAG: AI-2E family transporter, partial [Clostridia bacterium]|nr:AI-2E family transporter [Clostridia bacterium]
MPLDNLDMSAMRGCGNALHCTGTSVKDIREEQMPLNSMFEKLSSWNCRMNGLPRKGMLVATTLLLTWLTVVLAPLCWPFILALLFSMMLEPPVRLVVSHMRRVKVPRGLVTMVAMVLLFGILGVGLFALISRLLHEVVSLARSTPVFVNWLSNTLIPQLKGLYQQYSGVLP